MNSNASDGVTRVAAFCAGPVGGNPAGVWLGTAFPETTWMQDVASAVGYSETVFAVPADGRTGEGWRVRYFSPESEVPFCGHATIALGAVLALEHGDGVFALTTNHVTISVQGTRTGNGVSASLQSPPTSSTPAPRALVDEARQYSFDFLEWKRQYVLKQHWLAHAKKICPRCNIPYLKANLGRSNRRSFYCERCQKRYD